MLRTRVLAPLLAIPLLVIVGCDPGQPEPHGNSGTMTDSAQSGQTFSASPNTAPSPKAPTSSPTLPSKGTAPLDDPNATLTADQFRASCLQIPEGPLSAAYGTHLRYVDVPWSEAVRRLPFCNYQTDDGQHRVEVGFATEQYGEEFVARPAYGVKVVPMPAFPVEAFRSLVPGETTAEDPATILIHGKQIWYELRLLTLNSPSGWGTTRSGMPGAPVWQYSAVAKVISDAAPRLPGY